MLSEYPENRNRRKKGQRRLGETSPEGRRGTISYNRTSQVYPNLPGRVRVPVLRYFGKLEDELGKTPPIAADPQNGVGPSLRTKGIIHNNKGRSFRTMVDLDSGSEANIISTRLVTILLQGKL